MLGHTKKDGEIAIGVINIKKKTESFVKKIQKTEGWLGFSDLFGTSQPINVENRKTNLLDFLILITPNLD